MTTTDTQVLTGTLGTPAYSAGFAPGQVTGFSLDPASGCSYPTALGPAHQNWSAQLMGGGTWSPITFIYFAWGPEKWQVGNNISTAIGGSAPNAAPTDAAVTRTLQFAKRAHGGSGAWTNVATFTFNSDQTPADFTNAYATAHASNAQHGVTIANTVWPYAIIDTSSWGIAASDDVLATFEQDDGPHANAVKLSLYYQRPVNPALVASGEGGYEPLGVGDYGANPDTAAGGTLAGGPPATAHTAWSSNTSIPWSDWIDTAALPGTKSWIYGAYYRRTYLGSDAMSWGYGTGDSGTWRGNLQTRCRMNSMVTDAANTWLLRIEYQFAPTPVPYNFNNRLTLPDWNESYTSPSGSSATTGIYELQIGRNGFMSVGPYSGQFSAPSGSPTYEGLQWSLQNWDKSQMPVQAHLAALAAMSDAHLVRTSGAAPPTARWEFAGDTAELRALLEKISDNFSTQQNFKTTIPRTADALFDEEDGSGSGSDDPPFTPPDTSTMPTGYSTTISRDPWTGRMKKVFGEGDDRWLPEEIGEENWIVPITIPGPVGAVMPAFEMNAFYPVEDIAGGDWQSTWNTTVLAFRTFCVAIVIAGFLAAVAKTIGSYV